MNSDLTATAHNVPGRLLHMEARIERDAQHRAHRIRYRAHLKNTGADRSEQFQLRRIHGAAIKRFFSLTR